MLSSFPRTITIQRALGRRHSYLLVRRMSNQQPAWIAPSRPSQSEEPVLRVYNSLTKSKVVLSLGCTIEFDVLLELSDWICSEKRSSCKMVQLRAYSVRFIPHGPRQVWIYVLPKSTSLAHESILEIIWLRTYCDVYWWITSVMMFILLWT